MYNIGYITLIGGIATKPHIFTHTLVDIFPITNPLQVGLT